MDEKQTNDAKQVMLVQEAGDGRIRAVTGVDSVGNLHTVEPTQQNMSNLLNVNTQDAALETFFKKFMQEAENPSHTGIFIMAQSALEQLIRIDFDPEILENYRVDPASLMQEQRFEPLDTSKIDLDDLVKKGIRMEDLEPHLRAMSYGHKSNGLIEMNPELESGLRVATKGRVSLEEQADGSLKVIPHYWQEKPDLDAPFHGVLLDDEVKNNLTNGRHAGKIIDLELEPGKLTPCFVSRDKWTNTLEYLPVELLEKRAVIKNAELSEASGWTFTAVARCCWRAIPPAPDTSGTPIFRSTPPSATLNSPTTDWIVNAIRLRTGPSIRSSAPRVANGKRKAWARLPN